MKKIIAIVIALTVSVWLVGPGIAQGATAEELQAQIAALQVQLAALQTQLTALTGGAGATACTFTRNLYPGMSGADVQCLQQYLNSSGHPVAASGVGSAGHETIYFGSLTQAAVSAWQTANSVACGAYCGYFGPVSRAKYTAIGPVTPTCGNGTCDVGETHTSCAADCPAVTCGNGTCDTGETHATCPADCPAGPVTEGTYTVALAASPAGGTVTAGAGIPVYGIDIKALGSDITIGRVDLQVAVATTPVVVTLNPATFITKVAIYDGSTLVKEMPVGAADVTLDPTGVYYIRVIGFNFLVSKDTTKTLLVKIDTTSSIDVGRTLAVRVFGNGIRGVDGVGINTFAALATWRNWTLNVPGQGTLTASISTDNPTSNNSEINATDGVQNVSLLKFKLKSTVGDTILTRLSAQVASGASNAVPTIIALYDGDTLVASANPTTGVGTFENFRLLVPKDTTKSMTIKGDFNALTDSSINTVAGPVATNGLTIPLTTALLPFNRYERANGAQVDTMNAAIVAGNNQYLFEQGVRITFVSATNTVASSVGEGAATGIITFRVEPFGGTMTKPVAAVFVSGVANRVTILAYTAAGAVYESPIGAVSRTVVTNPDLNIPDGGSATITVTEVVADDGTTNVGLMQFKVEEFTWTTGLIAGGLFGTVGNMTDNWKTPYADLR